MKTKAQHKSRIHWRAIFTCFFLDIIVSQFVFAIAASIEPTIDRTSLFATTTGIVAWSLGLTSTVAAGWLAGYLAKEERFLHGFLVGGMGIVLLLLAALSGEQIMLDGLILTLIAAPLAGLAGYLSRWAPVRQRK